MSIEQMKDKLLQWNPSWNIHRFTDEQIKAIYNKERSKVVEEIMARYS